MDDDLLQKTRARIAHARRLASMINDPQAKTALEQMADESQADLDRMLAEEGGPPDGEIRPEMPPQS